jgi:hypothetical protein
MNKFLRPLFLLLTFSLFVVQGYSLSNSKVPDYLNFDLCMVSIQTKEQKIEHFSYDGVNESIVSLNCATPTILSLGMMVTGNTSGGDLFYQITIPAGQNANIVFNGTGDMVAEVITDCTLSPLTPYCGGGIYRIRIYSPTATTGPFDLTVTAYSATVTIDITENSGVANNGILCEGEDITLNANPVLSGSAVDTYVWSSGQATQGFTLTSVTSADAGTYEVTVTDLNGCTFSSSVAVVVNPLPTAAIAIAEMSGSTNDDGEICDGDQVTLTASGGSTYAWSNGVNNATNIVTPTSTITYTVTVTDVNGCQDTEEQQIIVYPLPTAGIDIVETSGNTDNDGNICEMDPITLTGTGGVSYEWNTTETTEDINPTLAVGPHTFTVTVTDANGCTDSHVVMVNVFGLPAITINDTENSGTTANDETVCEDDPLTLTVSFSMGAATIFDWDLPGGATNTGNPLVISNTTIADHNGTFVVTVTDVNGCTASASIDITVENTPVANDTELKACAIAPGSNMGDFVFQDAEDAPAYPNNQNDGQEIDNGDVRTVTYHSTLAGAQANTGAIASGVYSNGTTIYARVEESSTLCYDVAEILLTVIPLPDAIDTELRACEDPNNLGNADFILTDAELAPAYPGGNSNVTADIDGGVGGMTVTYHSSLFDAQNNAGVIGDGPYTNGTVIFARIEDPATLCFDVAQILLTVLPVPALTIDDIENSGLTPNDETVCEDAMLTLNVSATGTPATYDWELPDGSTSTTNPLSIPNATIAQHNGTFTVTVTDANGCTASGSIDITVNPNPTANDTELKACAISAGSNMGDFVLTDAGENPNYPTNQNDGLEVDNGDPMTVSYHLSNADAMNNANPQGDGVKTDGTILYARVFDPATGCYDISEVTLTVVDLPDALDTELRACEDPNNLGNADFTLTDAELAPGYPGGNSNVTADIDGGAGGMTVTYHPTLGDAENNTGAISDGPYANATVIFARIEDPATLCFDVAQILLTVLPLPTSNDTELRECEMPAGSGQAMFTLTDAEAAPGFPATNSNVTAEVDNGVVRTVTYHTSQADAENNVGAVGDGSYPDMTTLYARVEDPATGCASIAEVLLTVLEAPDPEIQFEGSPSNFTVCEDEAFDLNVVLTAGLAPYTYMWTLPDGSTGSGNPYPVAGAVPANHQGTWVVTVTDAGGCTGTDNISVTVDPAPPNNSCADAIAVTGGASGNNICANDGGGCGTNSESAVYFTYTVPATGLTSLTVEVTAPHVVSVSTACGGGDCTQVQTIPCPMPGATYYITVSSSEANEGNFTMSVRETIETPDITGTVYIDLDASGTFGGIDVGFQGAPVQLLEGCGGGGAVIASATTDANGNYTFTGVPPGMYLVQVDQSGAGAPQGTPNPKDCCLTVDPCLPDAVLECEMGYPPPNCTSNPFSVDNFCQTAYDNPLCDLTVIGQFACGQNPTEQGPWSGEAHCGGVYHNTSFYGFVAGSGNYNIEFTIFNCAGTGVQYGLMDVCSPGGPYVVCNGNANTGTVTVPAASLEPCKTYVFWIDGFSSSVCSYFIQVTGDFNVCRVPDIVDIEIETDCNPLCPILGALPVTVLGEPGIPNIESINNVTLTWTGTHNGNPFFDAVTTTPDGLTIDIPFIEAGTYEICVTTQHACRPPSTPFCKTFVFTDLEPTFKDIPLCTGDFPWTGEVDDNGDPVNDIHGNQWAWQYGMDVTLASVRSGTFNYSTEMTNACGCRYTQFLRITESSATAGIDTLAVCQSQVPYTYNGITFTGPVTDSLIKLDIETKNGCDSLVSLTSRILNMGGTLTDVCVQGGFELRFNMGLQFLNADRDSMKFVWKDAAGTVLTDNNSDSTNIVVPTVGAYSLEITVFKYGTGCTFTFNRTINLTGRLPLAPITDNWPQKICENDNEATYNVASPDPNLIYLWTVPATATKIMDDSTGTLIVRWNGPTGGDICVKARNLCGDGPETCLPVVYVDQIMPDFSMDTVVCKDRIIPITATSTHTAIPVVYNWNFDGGTSTNTTGTGPGPHNVTWNSTGTKTVTLFVSENGCVGDPVSKEIEVSELPAPPIVDCAGSTSSSVTFVWSSVVGATGYNVTIISPANISGTLDQNNNTYLVDGLPLGTAVTIQVTAVLPGPCGNITSANQTCTALDCGSLPTITVAPVAPICLPGSAFPLDVSSVTITNPPASPSTGSFTINGNPATTFDPSALGAGTHTITYTLVWDNSCLQSGSTPVIVRATPLSDFRVSQGLCVKDSVVVEYTGGTTGATFTWNFGPDVTGNYNGPGPHEVKWTNSGTKTITLTVTKDGCTSNVTSQNVTIDPLLAMPMVICADQRIDGVTFGWDAVTNASGYNIVVEVVGGATLFTGTVTGTTYDVPGLTEGTQVRITVTAVSTNGCPNTSDTQICTATSCPAAVITFPNQVITECLTSALGNIALPFTITNNLPNEVPTVTWSSFVAATNNAINNSVSPATFNPQLAGVGSHSLVLTYRQKDCIWQDSILITLKPKPLASFTMPDSICITESPLTVTYTGTATSGRTLAWENGGATRVDINPNTYVFTFPVIGSYTIGLTTTLNGCPSDKFTKTIVVDEALLKPVISCDESINAISFSWATVDNAKGYDIDVTKVAGGNVFSGIVTNNVYNVTGLSVGEEVTISVTALSDNSCPSTVTTLTCQATNCPDAKLSFPTLPSKRIEECLASDLTPIVLPIVNVVDGLPGVVPTITWTSSSSGIDNSTSPATFDPQVAGIGTHTLVLTYQQNECEWQDSIVVLLKPIPVASFVMADTICIDDSPITVSYTGTSTNGRILTWENVGATRTDVSSNSFRFTFPAAGTYNIGLTTTLNGCVSELYTESIVVEGIPSGPTITCIESLDAITFNWTDVPCATEFDVLVNGVSQGLTSTNTITVNGLMEGEKVDLEITAQSICACPIPTVTRTCEARNCPPVNITLTPAQTNICLTQNVSKIPITLTVTGNTPDGRGTWSGLGVDQNGLFDPAVAGLGTHVITYTYMDSNCTFDKTTSISVNSIPVINWEKVDPKCYSDLTGTFSYSIEGGTAPYTLTNDGNPVTGTPVTGVTAGSHTFVVRDVNGCTSSQVYSIAIPSQPSFNITGPAIVNINKESSHTLDITGMAAYVNVIDSVVWFWNGVRVCSGSLATCSTITNNPPVGPNSYAVTIYYNNGCKVVDDFQYIVTDTYITTFPNIINPESPINNKEFRIFTNDPSLFVKKMRVYDRWGNLVFIAENFSATDPVGWNGSFGGTDVVPGVYVYIFEMNSDSDDDIVETGDVTVVR